MRYWYQLASGIDVMPLMAAITRQPELWDNQTPLQRLAPPFKDTDSILLRFPEAHLEQPHEPYFWPAWYQLPEAHGHVFALMTALHGVRLGRVMINRLPSGCAISAHEDFPDYTSRWRRHHLVLHGTQDTVMRVGDELIPMVTGVLFWFNAAVEHEVINRHNDDRISMIIDIQTTEIA